MGLFDTPNIPLPNVTLGSPHIMPAGQSGLGALGDTLMELANQQRQRRMDESNLRTQELQRQRDAMKLEEERKQMADEEAFKQEVVKSFDPNAVTMGPAPVGEGPRSQHARTPEERQDLIKQALWKHNPKLAAEMAMKEGVQAQKDTAAMERAKLRTTSAFELLKQRMTDTHASKMEILEAQQDFAAAQQEEKFQQDVEKLGMTLAMRKYGIDVGAATSRRGQDMSYDLGTQRLAQGEERIDLGREGLDFRRKSSDQKYVQSLNAGQLKELQKFEKDYQPFYDAQALVKNSMTNLKPMIDEAMTTGKVSQTNAGKIINDLYQLAKARDAKTGVKGSELVLDQSYQSWQNALDAEFNRISTVGVTPATLTSFYKAFQDLNAANELVIDSAKSRRLRNYETATGGESKVLRGAWGIGGGESKVIDQSDPIPEGYEVVRTGTAKNGKPVKEIRKVR